MAALIIPAALALVPTDGLSAARGVTRTMAPSVMSPALSTPVGRREAASLLVSVAALGALPERALAGASTDLKTDRTIAASKYGPRVKTGRDYWANELPQVISSGNWAAVEKALSEQIDPKDKRQKRKLAGPILALYGPMELWASSFSRGAQRSEPTLEMLAALDDFKAANEQLQVAASKSVKSGGFFGFFGGKKELSDGDRQKNAREGYAKGTKALNAYLAVLNEQLKTIGKDQIATI